MHVCGQGLIVELSAGSCDARALLMRFGPSDSAVRTYPIVRGLARIAVHPAPGSGLLQWAIRGSTSDLLLAEQRSQVVDGHR